MIMASLGLACLYGVLGQAGMFQQPMGMYAQGQIGFQGQGGYSPMGGFRPKGPRVQWEDGQLEEHVQRL